MEKRIGSGETAIDKNGAEALRAEVISIRDAALNEKVPDFGAVVILSHTIAFMANAIREIWGEEA
jgi:hypothetical protein